MYTKTDLARDLIDKARALRVLIESEPDNNCRNSLVNAYKLLDTSLKEIDTHLKCLGHPAGLGNLNGYPLPSIK